jgi:creatinine amidohydrolase
MNISGYSIFDGTIADMTWTEVEQAAKNKAIMIVPIGVIEQHGPHLPLATDTYGAYILSRLIQQELEKQEIPSVIAPPYYYGITFTSRMFPGSLNVSSEAMATILAEILTSYMNSGFKKQFIISHHGEPAHNLAIFHAMKKAQQNGVDAIFLASGALADITVPRDQDILPESSFLLVEASENTVQAYERLEAEVDPHAGERETSFIMRWFADTLKDPDEVINLSPVSPTWDEFIQSARRNWREGFPLGYIGEPHIATKGKADVYIYEAKDAAQAIKTYLREPNR